jgi:hypothetical protein
MGSPFPGMDPYLEKHWRDVHASLIVYARDQMRGRLPRDLKARIEERVFLELPEGEGRSLYSEIRVVEQRHPGPPRAKSDGGVAVELYRVPLQERLPSIRIPLRESDVDISLELQPLIDLC